MWSGMCARRPDTSLYGTHNGGAAVPQQHAADKYRLSHCSFRLTFSANPDAIRLDNNHTQDVPSRRDTCHTQGDPTSHIQHATSPSRHRRDIARDSPEQAQPLPERRRPHRLALPQEVRLPRERVLRRTVEEPHIQVRARRKPARVRRRSVLPRHPQSLVVTQQKPVFRVRGQQATSISFETPTFDKSILLMTCRFSYTKGASEIRRVSGEIFVTRACLTTSRFQNGDSN